MIVREKVERVAGIEPAYSARKASILFNDVNGAVSLCIFYVPLRT